MNNEWFSEKKMLPLSVLCLVRLNCHYQRWPPCTVLECDHFSPWLKIGIFKCISKVNGSCLRVDIGVLCNRCHDLPSARLICTPRNFAQSSKFLGKTSFFGTKVTSESFLSISQNLKVTRPQGGTQMKIWFIWHNSELSRSFEHFWDSFMGSLICSSRWSDQKCCETECVALESSFQTIPMKAL